MLNPSHQWALWSLLGLNVVALESSSNVSQGTFLGVIVFEINPLSALSYLISRWFATSKLEIPLFRDDSSLPFIFFSTSSRRLVPLGRMEQLLNHLWLRRSLQGKVLQQLQACSWGRWLCSTLSQGIWGVHKVLRLWAFVHFIPFTV